MEEGWGRCRGEEERRNWSGWGQGGRERGRERDKERAKLQMVRL